MIILWIPIIILNLVYVEARPALQAAEIGEISVLEGLGRSHLVVVHLSPVTNTPNFHLN